MYIISDFTSSLFILHAHNLKQSSQVGQEECPGNTLSKPPDQTDLDKSQLAGILPSGSKGNSGWGEVWPSGLCDFIPGQLLTWNEVCPQLTLFRVNSDPGILRVYRRLYASISYPAVYTKSLPATEGINYEIGNFPNCTEMHVFLEQLMSICKHMSEFTGWRCQNNPMTINLCVLHLDLGTWHFWVTLIAWQESYRKCGWLWSSVITRLNNNSLPTNQCQFISWLYSNINWRYYKLQVHEI